MATPSPIRLRARSTFAFKHEVRGEPLPLFAPSYLSNSHVQGLLICTRVGGPENEHFQAALQSKHADWSLVHLLRSLGCTSRTSVGLPSCLHALTRPLVKSHNRLFQRKEGKKRLFVRHFAIEQQPHHMKGLYKREKTTSCCCFREFLDGRRISPHGFITAKHKNVPGFRKRNPRLSSAFRQHTVFSVPRYDHNINTAS